jgi:hypothetical protein
MYGSHHEEDGMPDAERFYGLTLKELEEATLEIPADAASAIGELIAAYRRVTAERDQLAARLELLRKAAQGGGQ